MWLLLSKLESWMALGGRRSLLSGLLESYPYFWDEALAWGHICYSRSVLVCSLELPWRRGLALFELDRWVRVSLCGEGALSVVLVEYSWRLEEES